LRLAQGLPLDVLTAAEQARVPSLVASGLGEVAAGRLRPTLRGRLLADAVVRDLLD
jgi:oxygen-independent coproporphyrinogen-3 oxidase